MQDSKELTKCSKIKILVPSNPANTSLPSSMLMVSAKYENKNRHFKTIRLVGTKLRILMLSQKKKKEFIFVIRQSY